VGVLKVSNAAEDPLVLDLEAAAARHVKAHGPTLPVALPLPPLPGRSPSDARAAWAVLLASRGDALNRRRGLLGTDASLPTVEAAKAHWCRLYAVAPGRTLNFEDGPLPALTLQRWGAGLAQVGRALRGFWHPAMTRPTAWDVQVGVDTHAHMYKAPCHAQVRARTGKTSLVSLKWSLSASLCSGPNKSPPPVFSSTRPRACGRCSGTWQTPPSATAALPC
jgi:Ser/Thr protein kinase RdoA (MazF antagonist)